MFILNKISTDNKFYLVSTDISERDIVFTLKRSFFGRIGGVAGERAGKN
jgi:hypothetical protein